MKSSRLLFLILLLLTIRTARADLEIGEALLMGEPSGYSLLQVSLTSTRTLTCESASNTADQLPVNLPDMEQWELNLDDDSLLGGYTAAQAPFILRGPVRQLPAGPGSVGLFISAALTLGAWQVVRSAKYVHLSHLPDWYQSNTPDQIGHALVFDLQYLPIAACPLEQLKGKPDDIVGRWHDMPSYGLSQFFQIIESPRGPPIFSL